MTTARRLFFALWPGPETLVAATAAVHRLVPPGTGRPQRPDQLHLTLEFLGGVPEPRLRSVLEAGEAVAGSAAPFEIVLDRLEHWQRPQVLCLTASVVPEPLGALVRSLRAALSARGLRPGAAPVQAAPDAGPQSAAAAAGWVGRAAALGGARVLAGRVDQRPGGVALRAAFDLADARLSGRRGRGLTP